MSERAGRGEVRVKPHLLDQYRPTHKPCSPLREHSLGADHTGPPKRDPFALAVLRAFLRALQVGLSKSLQEGLPGPLPTAFRAVSVPNPSPAKNRPGTFQNPPQPLPGLTDLQGFQAKPLQTASSDSSGALKAPPISLNKEMAMIIRHAGRPAFGFARPALRFVRGDSSTLTASAQTRRHQNK